MRVSVDLDGTICATRQPEQSYDEVAPLPGAVEKLQILKQAGHEIIISTARNMESRHANVGAITAKQVPIIAAWLTKHNIPFDEIWLKPLAVCYLDDRAIRFNGSWSGITSASLGLVQQITPPCPRETGADWTTHWDKPVVSSIESNMSERAFFIDTADKDYIAATWDKLSKEFAPEEFRGVTTNPNAFAKLNLMSLHEWEKTTKDLCSLVTAIKGGRSGGVVYVQAPSSTMSPEDVVRWAYIIINWTDGYTRVGLKIPPFKEYLSIVPKLNALTETNVTGVADAGTALMALSYGVRYVSIIPGRMEEQGVDAKSHIAYVNQRKPDGAEIITGSMRTVEGLKRVCEYGTVPTIGTRVFDMLLKHVDQFATFWDEPVAEPPIRFCPSIAGIQTVLSEDFFAQMDKCGDQVAKEFLGR